MCIEKSPLALKTQGLKGYRGIDVAGGEPGTWDQGWLGPDMRAVWPCSASLPVDSLLILYSLQGGIKRTRSTPSPATMSKFSPSVEFTVSCWDFPCLHKRYLLRSHGHTGGR